MRYYVTTDVHGHYTELKNALQEKGFFDDPKPHKLIVCGDLFDRGQEALALQHFILDLLIKDQAILIRGNHEDMTMELLHQWENYSFLERHHLHNGAVNTVRQLTGSSERDLMQDHRRVGRAFLKTSLVQSIIPAMKDYFETDNYIFVHGWIPFHQDYKYNPQWRDAERRQWVAARWTNGMEAAHRGVLEEGKTIVCGHYNCSYGHCHYHGDGSEFDKDANWEPYYDEGIIALDACTAYTHKVNCIVIDD